LLCNDGARHANSTEALSMSTFTIVSGMINLLSPLPPERCRVGSHDVGPYADERCKRLPRCVAGGNSSANTVRAPIGGVECGGFQVQLRISGRSWPWVLM